MKKIETKYPGYLLPKTVSLDLLCSPPRVRCAHKSHHLKIPSQPRTVSAARSHQITAFHHITEHQVQVVKGVRSPLQHFSRQVTITNLTSRPQTQRPDVVPKTREGFWRRPSTSIRSTQTAVTYACIRLHGSSWGAPLQDLRHKPQLRMQWGSHLLESTPYHSLTNTTSSSRKSTRFASR